MGAPWLDPPPQKGSCDGDPQTNPGTSHVSMEVGGARGGFGTRPRYQIVCYWPSPLLILTLCGSERVLVVSGARGGVVYILSF